MSSPADFAFFIASLVARTAMAVVVTYVIIKFRDTLETMERVGAGLLGGSALLTIPVVLDVHRAGTPFDAWAGLVGSIGVVGFFIGYARRRARHRRANREQVERSREYLRSRGKLPPEFDK